YQWTRWVVNYAGDTQAGVLENLLGGVSPWRITALLVGGGALALAVVAFWLLGRPARVVEAEEVRLYRKFLRRMAARGYPCAPGMAPQAYAQWLAAQSPQSPQGREAAAVAYEFSRLSYRP